MVPITAVNLSIAFLAGVLSFFAGCLIPVVPSYISYLTGITSDDPQRYSAKNKGKAFIASLFFVLGFIGIFILLGVTLNTFSRILTPYKPTVQLFGGLFITILGLHFMGIWKIPILYRHFQIKIDGKILLPKGNLLSAVLLGATFGFAWTPCVGPVLASILFWSSQAATFKEGLLLILLFGLGLGVPFVIMGVFIDSLYYKVRKLERYSSPIQKVSGAFLIITGVLFLTGQYSVISNYLIARFNNWAFVLEFQK